MLTFYQYLLTFRHSNENNEIVLFAEHVFLDHSFPKQSRDYHELSSYLEMNVDYILNMSLFDEIWMMYEEYRYKKN
ncbi:MAG: YozE family protein [Bacillales bacterium]|jgi:uncharacterized protein YozE (UPF0346 family)|nr:YozE family protein [Bacillales bacterium]